MADSIKEQLASTPLFGGNASAVEHLYEQYLENPEAVPAGWREYFETMGDAETEIVHDPRSRVLDEHVCIARQSAHQVAAGCRSQIDRERALASVGALKGVGHTAPGMTDVAHELAGKRLHFDDVRALVGHQHGRERSRQHGREVQHSDTLQGTGHD